MSGYLTNIVLNTKIAARMSGKLIRTYTQIKKGEELCKVNLVKRKQFLRVYVSIM